MNFLAHLHLADISHTSLVAILAGKFETGDIDNTPKHLQQGLWLQRQIQHLTETHELTKELLQKFPKSLAHAAPTIIDVCFDHMLAKYWDEYHHQSLEDFSANAFSAINACNDLPQELLSLATQVQQINGLVACQNRAGLNKALASAAQRAAKPETFKGAEECVKKLDIEIEIAFRTYYPQLMAYTRLWTRKTPAEYL
ncbi:ACP phosphodiesterase [Shewanella youngdeokensis]|uniref:ACP phosphodiesterase n=1 Tax=Shewanella youngdeokensis TaxID=2999068 RepID=A0ABZ0K3M1_9GAMM|nr:ACP phosphodiesterase [Shewanella sp. DAU334]